MYVQFTDPQYKWTTLTPLQQDNVNCQCIYLSNSNQIWTAARYDMNYTNGMEPYDCATNTEGAISTYPTEFKPEEHSICGSDDVGIIVVDAHGGSIIPFDPTNQTYGTMVPMKKLGWAPPCIEIQGQVHIMHGFWNNYKGYLIYSIDGASVTEHEDNLQYPREFRVSFTKRSDDSEFYQFGGINADEFSFIDTFYVGKLDNGDPTKPIIWTENRYFRLLRGIARFGVIQYGPYIVIFGGEWTKGMNPNTADIDVLDTRSRADWTRSPIKCPEENEYTAVLDDQLNVHLFTNDGDNKHYSISLKAFIPDLDSLSVPQQVLAVICECILFVLCADVMMICQRDKAKTPIR